MKSCNDGRGGCTQLRLRGDCEHPTKGNTLDQDASHMDRQHTISLMAAIIATRPEFNSEAFQSLVGCNELAEFAINIYDGVEGMLAGIDAATKEDEGAPS